MLETSVSLYAGAFPRLVVVLRPEDRRLADDVAAAGGRTRVEIIYCSEAIQGMGHSLAAGARAAADWRYLFVALADMPWIRAETLTLLRQEMESRPADTIIVPTFEGRPGHPVGFGARYLPRLAALSGDAGARQVILTAADRVDRVAVADPGVVKDLDTPPAND